VAARNGLMTNRSWESSCRNLSSLQSGLQCSKETQKMNRTQESRLDRLQKTADMRGETKRQAERRRASDEGDFEGLTIEEILALPKCSLTMEDVLYAEALAADADALTVEADDDMGNDP
jgi:hypothetical protein